MLDTIKKFIQPKSRKLSLADLTTMTPSLLARQTAEEKAELEGLLDANDLALTSDTAEVQRIQAAQLAAEAEFKDAEAELRRVSEPTTKHAEGFDPAREAAAGARYRAASALWSTPIATKRHPGRSERACQNGCASPLKHGARWAGSGSMGGVTHLPRGMSLIASMGSPCSLSKTGYYGPTQTQA
jgi:hypothetical protein